MIRLFLFCSDIIDFYVYHYEILRAGKLENIEYFLQFDNQPPIFVFQLIFEVFLQGIDRSSGQCRVEAMRSIELATVRNVWIRLVLDLDGN
mmetsp:Transcript_14292/g.34510  ORF Transcript_14292/g.34510 Transcript_14292/m.34510 type:complete len:91 (-) Transcript_14292:2608-2880(-)